MTIAAGWVRTLDNGAEELIFCSDSYPQEASCSEMVSKHPNRQATVTLNSKFPRHKSHSSQQAATL
jgi:hypothetical protein